MWLDYEGFLSQDLAQGIPIILSYLGVQLTLLWEKLSLGPGRTKLQAPAKYYHSSELGA